MKDAAEALEKPVRWLLPGLTEHQGTNEGARLMF